ncbi:MAG: hypothetical protein HY663_02770, partial [Chloroflexi bacterium]|nr:hypothetical protein [Chloroflexota bacterium]
ASLAVQCSANNYHFVPEYGIVELLPIEENPTYIRAEIVSTSFLNMAMPMIRYRLNDHVMMYKGKSCPCGRPGHVIKQIDGRIEDVIVTPEGNLIGRMDHIFKDMVNIKESQIVQDSIDSLTVKVVKRPSYTGRDEDTLMHELTSRLGKHISIRFDYMEFIPRTASGKFRAVVSHLKPEQRRLNAATSSNTKRNG